MDGVKELIEQSFTSPIVEITDLTGTRDHLGILVASDDFKGLGLLEQHQKVMDVLSERLKQDIHAVKIKTMTREKYDQRNS